MERGSLEAWQWEPEGVLPDLPHGAWVPQEREREIEALLEEIRQEGYPLASIQILEAEDSAEGLSVRAGLRRGPRLRLTAVVFEGAGGTRASYLERVSGLRRGRPIRPDEADAARDRLERTGLFAEVHGPWLRAGESGGGVLVYRMVSLPQNRAEGAVGYDGETQTLSGFVHVELGNLFGTGRRLAAAWDRYTSDRSALNLAYREPYVAGLPISAEVSLSQSLEDSTWTRDEIAGTLQGELGGGWFARAGLGRQRIVYSGEPSSRSKRLATRLGLGAEGRSEAGTRGARFLFDVDTGSLHSSPERREAQGRLVKVAADAEANLPLRSLWHLRGELQAGWIEGPDSLPRPEAIGLGGGGSLRGYAEQQFRVLRFGLGRLEGGVRLLPEGNRIYLFVDHAVLRRWPDGRETQQTGYGLGVRIRAATGWVRLDYGIASGESPISGRLHFRLETRF
jgi:outer membrane protein assembly factor BamA